MLTDKDLWGKPLMAFSFVLSGILISIGFSMAEPNQESYALEMMIIGSGLFPPLIFGGLLYPEQTARILGKQKQKELGCL